MKNYSNAKYDVWYEGIVSDLSTLPFSFTYGGELFRGFSPDNFTLVEKSVEKIGDKEITAFRFLFKDGIEVTLKTVHYYDFGASEWTVWFENASDKNTKIISKLESSVEFEGKYPTLKGIHGDYPDFYSPYCVDLAGTVTSFSSDSGRATHGNFPYFNLECGDGGVMIALGWAGTWHAEFSSDGEKTVFTGGAVNGLCSYLKPGEKIRSALFVIAPYLVRNEHFATNYWRSWYIKYNLPKENNKGDTIRPFSTTCIAGDTGLPNSDGSISERYFTWRPSLEKMIEEDVKVDFRWFDAGWYIAPNGDSPEVDWWGTVGTWEIDKNKWPDKTFLESTDFARENGMRTLVWFEPERVTDPENLAKNYGYNTKWAIKREGVAAISNNIGDPECFRWTVDRICKFLRENKVEMYREDNNCDAAGLWKYMDDGEGEGRRGITESKFIIGHYAMWDEIIACTLSLGGCGFVDSCASGGGRNDLESMRRGIPLLRSDHDRTSTAMRLSMTTAFNKWIPVCGALNREKTDMLNPKGVLDTYVWRASYLPVLNIDSQFVQDKTTDFEMLRFGMREWKRINKYFLDDFYTLTPWNNSVDKNNFTAYSFYNGEDERGVILAVRQEDCVPDTLKIKMPYIKSGSEYKLTDADTKIEKVMSGDELMANLSVVFSQKREAKLIYIEKIQ